MQAASGNIRRAASLILIVQDKLTKIDKSRMDYKVNQINVMCRLCGGIY